MDKGENRVTSLVLRIIKDKIEEIEFIILENINKEIKPIEREHLNVYFNEQYNNFKISEEDYMILRNYTGYNFKGINNLLRNKWNYEFNGKLDETKRYRFSENAKEISNLIKQFPLNTLPFKTYRGVTIDAFRDYGIYTIEELEYIKGKYMYEEGFTSTSLVRETSYFNQEIEGNLYDIEIEYIIPAYSNDGMPLLTQSFSYSPGQNEYVLDKGALSKIYDVVIDKENKRAHLKAILIPKKVYDDSYKTKDNKEVGGKLK